MTTAGSSGDRARRLAWASEVARRLVCALALSVFVYRALVQYRAHGGLVLVLLVIGEALTVVCIVTARFSTSVDRTPLVSATTLVASFYFLVVKVSPGLPLVPVNVGVAIQVAGLLLQIASKLWLGRSFGLLPANRGVVTSGPYRLVRHPIYLGYFLNHVGFLLGSFSPWNFGVYASLYVLQIGRIVQEEKHLRADERYERYTHQVRYRLVPGIF